MESILTSVRLAVSAADAALALPLARSVTDPGVQPRVLRRPARAAAVAAGTDPAYGLALTRVEGSYDRGGRATTGSRRRPWRSGHPAAREHPDRSLGIVAFSIAQRNTVEELLELTRRSDPVLDAFLHVGHHEDVFVKNIENVQGDERDVVLIVSATGRRPRVDG